MVDITHIVVSFTKGPFLKLLTLLTNHGPINQY
jgi:hypothetical protein